MEPEYHRYDDYVGEAWPEDAYEPEQREAPEDLEETTGETTHYTAFFEDALVLQLLRPLYAAINQREEVGPVATASL